MADISDQIESITARPGLFTSLGSPESLLRLDRFLRTPGVVGTVLAEQLLAFAAPETAHLSTMLWKRVAAQLRDFILGRPVYVEREENVWIPIEVHGLYCPAVPGAKASLAVDRTTKEKGNCSVSVLGIGGGHEFTVEIRVGDEFSVEESSVLVRYLILGTVAHCVMEMPEGLQRFVRLERMHKRMQRVELFGTLQQVPETSWGDVLFVREYDLRHAPASNTVTLENTEESEWRGSPGLKIESLGVEVKAEYVATKKWHTVFTYELPAGHFFVARMFPNRCFVTLP